MITSLQLVDQRGNRSVIRRRERLWKPCRFTCSLFSEQVAVNQDKTSQQLAALRARIQELELELQEFKSGRVVVSESGSVVMNDMATEITMLRTENDK